MSTPYPFRRGVLAQHVALRSNPPQPADASSEASDTPTHQQVASQASTPRAAAAQPVAPTLLARPIRAVFLGLRRER